MLRARVLTRLAAALAAPLGLCVLAAALDAGPKPARAAAAPAAAPAKTASALPGFNADVMPILVRAGCSSGPCHGANAGRGGFHLSLLGYDPDSDWEALTRFVGARRVSVARPDNSLILRKATGRMPHGGGARFAPDSYEYKTLRAWIASGAPAPSPTEPTVARLEVSPGARTLPVGGKQQVRVVARLSDGTRRDVTAQTLFSSGDGAILDVKPSGLATVVGPGEGAVVIRYRGVFTVARVTAPFGLARPIVPGAAAIDRLVNHKLAALGLVPSPRCSDEEFLRRASLDVTGRLPAPDAVRAFLADASADKRAQLVDRLLASPEYVDFWTLKWSDMLRNSQKSLGPKGMAAYHGWIRKSVADNKPWDQVTRELITASGSTLANGAANYFRAGVEGDYPPTASPLDLGESTAQVHLGVRLQCARCHNHPFEKWTQNQFYQLAAYFGRVGAENGKEDGEKILKVNTGGEVTHPKSGRAMTPTPLDGAPLPADYKNDRRAALADWMTSPANPFFSRVLANRLWKHYLGRGIVEPVDDFRVTNPPTNAPLLDHLAASLRKNNYDLKRLMREILLSDTYGRSARALPENKRDTRYFARFLPKRLTAEQLLDALNDVTGAKEKFAGYPDGTRAVQLMDTSVASSFLDAFGRPPRQTTCECERGSESGVTQALRLMNGAEVQDKIAAPDGRLAALVKANTPPPVLADELYLSALARYPTPPEKARAIAWLEKHNERAQAVQDLAWALVNSKEFVFNR